MSTLVINTADRKSKINKNIYGQFSEHLGHCIYDGLYVGPQSKIPNVNGVRRDVIDALRKIHVPVLRWPGGCFAEEYHWKDGIGPKETRRKMVNTNWGGVTEDNSFGTHEFLDFCDEVGCEPYINGNVGSGTVQELSEWVEYLNFDGISPMTELRKKNGRTDPWGVRYFCFGNENWGNGGHMRPEYYADLYRRYTAFAHDFGSNKLFRIACGPNVDDYNWMDKVMKSAAPFLDAISLHYYTIPGEWEHKGSALLFDEAEYYETIQKALHMEDLIRNHTEIMNRYDPEHRVGLVVDEWGTWFDVEPGTNPGFLYQQNTMRDALVAAVTLNIFNQHSDRVVMANIAQMVNVLQAVLLTKGSQIILTPTYHVFDLYQAHQNATLVGSFVQADSVGSEKDKVPQISVSASEDGKGTLHITAANVSCTNADEIKCRILSKPFQHVKARILSGEMHRHNTFEEPDAVQPADFSEIQVNGDTLSFSMPRCSVIELTVD
ncbi:MAG: alpha-N-arabinofuranosidase [Oscillospiraceae bacterium]|jgi:alpha-N-arabinofuranosidase|nr:alpha-N-arabinofuranosidase [Oscillospiraceae bacterium]MDD3260500.1 alpha-L-arabinofuranosidase C-terminal domain-containing protein [Oscillospiraceae bacterium]